MTRPRRAKPAPAQPLPERIRAALAADWTSLTTLDALTGARGSDARRTVHEALRALRSEGATLEERVVAAGVEVRLGPVVAPAAVPSDDARAIYQAIKDAGPVRCVLVDGSTPNALNLDTRGEPSPEERAAHARINAIVSATAPRPCRPPICHRDDIHEPSRVRGFNRPLCEEHRQWVEAAGGTLAAGGLARVVQP